MRVVDLTQYVAGPYCTQVLADLGAEVVKVERPGAGDVYRRQGPIFAGGESASFLALNRGKKSVELNLRDTADLGVLKRLIAISDVVIENSRPQSLRRYGLDGATLRAEHPRLVYCSISAFGQQGPDAHRGGYDLTMQALTGLMSITGHPDQPPAKIPIAALDFGTALYAAVGVLAALRKREATGEGDWVTTSLFECAIAWLSMHIVTVGLGGDEPQPSGNRSPFFAPYEGFRTQDGYLVLVGTGGQDAWGKLCDVLRLPELRDDPRFSTNEQRVRNVDDLHEIIEAVLVERSTNYWVELLDHGGITCAPVRRLGEALASEQAAATEMVRRFEHPTIGGVALVALPLQLVSAELTSTQPPPLLGADTEAVLAEVSVSRLE